MRWEIADAGVVAVLVLLGALVFEVFAEVAEARAVCTSSISLQAQLLDAVVDLLPCIFCRSERVSSSWRWVLLYDGHSPPDAPAPGAASMRCSSPPERAKRFTRALVVVGQHRQTDAALLPRGVQQRRPAARRPARSRKCRPARPPGDGGVGDRGLAAGRR